MLAGKGFLVLIAFVPILSPANLFLGDHGGPAEGRRQMADGEDLYLAQLLCTRLCHDLAGPIGAVAAGVELVGGDPSMADAETLGLIGSSSAAATRKLKFLRAVLGAPGAVSSNPGEIKTLLEGYLTATAGPSGPPDVTWPAADQFIAVAGRVGAAAVQIILNMCMLALEAQPGCRSLKLTVEAEKSPLITVEVASAREVAVRADLMAAIAGDAASLSARTVQAYWTARIVKTARGTLTLAPMSGGLCVTASFAGAAP